jgi:Glycosyl transferases group 1
LTPQPTTLPSVLVPTTRYHRRLVSYGSVVDFENAAVRCADADIVPVAPVSRRDRLAGLSRGTFGRRKETAPRDAYDLCLVVAMNVFAIDALALIRNFRSVARRVAVYVFDSWPEDVRHLKRHRSLWEECDRLFVSFPEAVEPYSNVLGCPVEYMPQAIDPERFHPHRGERPIHVTSIGRRHPEAHRLLLELAARRDLFYYYSEVDSPQAIDLEESQRLLGRISQSTRAAVCWPVSAVTGRRRSISPVTIRWFEAAACGSVVLGQAPAADDFHELFPYERFVRPLDPADPARFEQTVLEAVRDEEERVERLRLAEHVRTAHSWDARLARILDVMAPGVRG